jgi:hypothetical protein
MEQLRKSDPEGYQQALKEGLMRWNQFVDEMTPETRENILRARPQLQQWLQGGLTNSVVKCCKIERACAQALFLYSEGSCSKNLLIGSLYN